jgi:cell wall-associated NlpC family hydrolase
MSREKIVNIARQEVGYSELPPNSNKTKFGEWFGFDGVPWCGMFVSWVFDQAGLPLGNIGFRRGFAGCQTAVAHFRKNKQITKFPQIGDIVFFDWNLDNRYDHTGIFVRHINNELFEAVEGNTSYFNDSNGGEVMIRVRKYDKRALFVNPLVPKEPF